jgi:hypothetical protein
VTSRLISSPTTKKNSAISASFSHNRRLNDRVCPATVRPTWLSHSER